MLHSMGNKQGQAMRIPEVDLSGCDALLWREGENFYVLLLPENEVHRVRNGALAGFITGFPEQQTLCIIDEETGKAVRISPLAH